VIVPADATTQTIADWAKKAAGDKRIVGVRISCVVTAVDDGFDATTVTCRVRTFGVTYRDGRFDITAVKVFPNNNETPKITGGISIVK
jgi:hypothetical protein